MGQYLITVRKNVHKFIIIFLHIYYKLYIFLLYGYLNFSDSVSNGLVHKLVLLLICIYYTSAESSEIKDMKELISKTGTSKENLELITIAQPIR